jgi:uncharacterized repeat protein (TIGR01451 family)
MRGDRRLRVGRQTLLVRLHRRLARPLRRSVGECAQLLGPGDARFCPRPGNLYALPGGVVAPYFTYNHNAQVVAGESCPTGSSSIAGVAFYTSGPFPDSYDGALFFADYSRDCIWVMFPGGNGLPNPSNRATFQAPAANPVDLQVGPDGALYYADFDGGTIRRIAYALNQPPIASATGSPTNGPAPLTVSFDDSGSSDPEGGPLTYAWDLDGDGAFDDSTTVTPTCTYTQPGTYDARLRVTDAQNLSTTSSPVMISANNTPPTANIQTPATGTTWKVGDLISFSGSATDAQQGTLPASALSWELILQHCPSNCHQHPLQTWPGVSNGSFTAPDHEYPSYLELRLTATDGGGLTDTKTLRLDPRTVVLSFQSAVRVGTHRREFGHTTPFTREVIEGSNNTVSAPSPQTLNGTNYGWVSWSDGGAQSHNVVANTAATYTAEYQAVAPPQSADLALVKTGALNGSATWNLQVSNQGPGTAQDGVVTDTLPSRVCFLSAPGCTYDGSTRTVRCEITSLVHSGMASFTITTSAPSKGNGWITNTAQLSSSTPDPNTANNTASARVRR